MGKDMNYNHSLSLEKKVFTSVLRILTLVGFFIAAVLLVQVIINLMDFVKQNDISMAVVVLYYLQDVFFVISAVFFAFGVHKIASGAAGDNMILYGFASIILGSIDSLVYCSVSRNMSWTYYVVYAIMLVCCVILFFYFQGVGSKAMAVFGAIFNFGCILLLLEEMIRYIYSIDTVSLFDIRFAISRVLYFIVGIVAVVLSIGITRGLPSKGADNNKK